MRMFRCLDRSVLTLLAAIAALTAPGWAQSMGDLKLEVKDSSGAAVSAKGIATSLDSGVKRAFDTDSQGSYTLSGLPYGRYRVQISKQGFTTASVVVDLQTSSDSRSITMSIGVQQVAVDVVSMTPLPGDDRARDEIPLPIQTGTEKEIEATGSINLGDFLNKRFTSVYVNEMQGNPFQPDVNYRGYTASPLLGTPQGLSVYMDGVRLNQPFGDVVSWDLFPTAAIAETTLIPGSNPLFGLNTLGGALSITTKDGNSNAGTFLTLSGGSFGRKNAEFEHGGSNKHGWSWYGAANMFFEDGWRVASPTNVRQFFGRLGWQGTKTVLSLSVAYANNALTGNGLQEQRLLAAHYSSVYTIPDETANKSPFLNFSFRHSLSANLSFSGNAYFRYIKTRTLNGDLNDDSLDQSVYQPSAADIVALTKAGYTGFPTSGANASNTPFPKWRCIAQALQRDEPGEKCTGLLNRTNSEQYNYGVFGQATWTKSYGGNRNQLVAGGGFDGSNVDFNQLTELGYLNPDYSVTGVGAFGDGVTGGNVDGVPFDTQVNLHGRIRTGSFYITDSYTVANRLTVTVSGRFNHTSVDNEDRLRPSGPGTLTSNNSFDRFNPAAGFTYRASSYFTPYFNYSEGNRAPTSIELGCADPNLPCKLPNALAGDPPLKQVVTRTFEAGLRGGGSERKINWEVGWFRANNHNDILFVASEQTGFGYFKNFGETRRQGVEVNLNSHISRLRIGGGYTFLDATYQSTETIDGSSNSTSSEGHGLEGTIQVNPGNHIPLIPQHMLKGYADLQATSKLSIDLDLIAVSSAYARGNENNQHQADGVYYLGPGKSGGYAVLNLGAHYQLNRRFQLFMQINNLLDRKYYTAALLGGTGITPAGTFLARPLPAISGEFPVIQATFLAPGAPIGAWGGIKIRF
jgi:outer membrane receptor protein involved in Fe transport